MANPWQSRWSDVQRNAAVNIKADALLLLASTDPQLLQIDLRMVNTDNGEAQTI